MPEHYSSIGEAVGAAMQHNIRLAQRSEALGSDSPLQARHLPSASADPYSVRGMIARLHEDATPEEVAGIIEKVNGALVGALPELTELVAAAADWTRGRLEFPADPEVYPTWETWKALAAAHEMLHDVHEELAVAADGVAACPAQRADLRHTRRSAPCGAENCSTTSSVPARSPRTWSLAPQRGISIPRSGGRQSLSRSRPSRPRRASRPAPRRPPRRPRPRHGLPVTSAETFPSDRQGADP